MLNKPNFAEERAKLRSKCVYMADDDFLKRVQWYKLQDFDRVVTLEEAERFENDQAAAALSQDPSEETEVHPPRPAVLAAIVRFSRQDRFFMSACSGWTPATPLRGGPAFPQCRASAIAEDPRNIPEIEGDFETGVRQMIELCNEHGAGPQAVGLIDWSNLHQHLCFQVGHRIIERKPIDTPTSGQTGSQKVVDEEEEEEEEDDPEFRIDGWPVQHPEAQKELNKLQYTHITRPIPAYNIAGKRIRPSRYTAELRGAVVRLEFYLIHRVINERHVFTADVERIRVLVPAPPFDTPTPRRKRVAQFDDFDDDNDEAAFPPSPTKKPRRKC